MQKEIIELIKSLIKDTAFGEITSETELIESGILDSFALITMMTELESKYQIEISDEYFAHKICDCNSIGISTIPILSPGIKIFEKLFI